MKQPIRYFSIGLLISTLLLFGYYAFFLKEAKPKEITAELTTDEMVDRVEAEGFKVITNEQYIAFSLATEGLEVDSDKKEDKKNDKTEDKKENKKEDKKEKDEEEDEEELSLITHTFVTEDNVVSQDIAKILEDNKIIDNQREFLTYLEENDYMKYIQIGKFTVSNDMSFKEIAEIITTYPGK